MGGEVERPFVTGDGSAHCAGVRGSRHGRAEKVHSSLRDCKRLQTQCGLYGIGGGGYKHAAPWLNGESGSLSNAPFLDIYTGHERAASSSLISWSTSSFGESV